MIRLITAALLLSSSVVAQDDLDLLKRSLEERIEFRQRLNSLEERVDALEGRLTAPVAVHGSETERGQVVVVTADWCPQCRADSPQVTAALKALRDRGWNVDRDVRTVKLESQFDEAPYGVTALPAYLFVQNGEVVRRLESGKQPDQWSLGWLWKGVDERPLASGEAAHTPHEEVVRVIQSLPTPKVGFVDFGCGYDARWCVVAAERWKDVPITGIELDPERAEAAKTRVRELGLDHRITIVQGDATEVEVEADVGVAYLYPETLEKLRPRLAELTACASYLHQVPGLSMSKSGDTYVYRQPVTVYAASQYSYQPQQTRGAYYGGRYYSRPVCNSPNCQMCNAIRRQLGY